MRIEDALSRPGLTAIVGLPGTGKTLLLQNIVLFVRASGGKAALVRPNSEPDGGRPDVVLIDDADGLAGHAFESLSKQKVPVVVTGGPKLIGKLMLAKVPATIVTLRPLTPHDAEAFIGAQLARADQPAGLIQPAALTLLIQRSQGVPRSLQLLAGLAVFMARLADVPQVTVAYVEQAALVQSGTTPVAYEADVDEEAFAPDVQPPLPRPVQPAPPPPEAASPARRPGLRRGAAAAWLGALCAAAGGGWLLTTRLAQQPAASVPARMASAQMSPGQASPGQASPGQASPGQASPGQASPGQASPGPTASARASVAAAPQPPPKPDVPPAPARAVAVPPFASDGPARAAPALTQVVIFYAAGASDAGPRAAELAASLRSLGYQVPPPEPGPKPGEAGVTYVFPEDRPVATAVAYMIGAGVAQLRPAAEWQPGTIHVTLAPDPAGRTAVSPQLAKSKR